jgi:integrase/recombinase XerD
MNRTPDMAALFDGTGRRKYLCDSELVRFHLALRKADPATRSFCQLIAMTGCRISEALATTPKHLDSDAKRVIFRTLKRRKVAFRAVPVPDALMQELLNLATELGDDDRLWPWARQTGWRKIGAIMESAEISGPMAMPKGLRHAYGIRAAGENVPPSLIQRWLGHADPDTTAIYINAVGKEERKFAERVWLN